MESILSKSNENDSLESVRERLKEFRHLYQVGKYRPSPKGKYEVDDESMVQVKTGGVKSNTTSNEKGSKGPNPGNIEDLLAAFKKPGGMKAELIYPDPFPNIKWISVGNGTRAIDEMEDRAAKFYEKENLIKANSDYQGYKDVMDYFIEEFKSFTEAENVIKEVVRDLFAQQLLEVVAGALSLKNRPQWNPDDIEKALSEESLTTAVSCRYFIVTKARKQIKKKLEKTKIFDSTKTEALSVG